jgi:hypothetical protein
MKPYIVLGVYKPPVWKAFKVGRALCAMTKNAGLQPHVDPAHGPLNGAQWHSDMLHAECRKRSFKTKQAESWHFDGDLEPGAKTNCGIVLWSSCMPTLIKRQQGGGLEIIYQPKPFEVVLFRNLFCFHRRPTGVPRDRWTFRQRVAVPAHIQLP